MISLLSWFLIICGISGGIGCCWYLFPRERNYDTFFYFESDDSDDSDVYERIPYNIEY